MSRQRKASRAAEDSDRSYSSYGDFQQPEAVRHTPSSLGWSQATELVKLYKFILPKGKLPYFELLEKFTPTYETSDRVYLDESK
jgi:hypothetical protein